MPTLTEFLLARIAEDEAMAQWALRDGYATDRPLQYAETGHNTLPDLTIDPARLLAECEAKRRIVELHPTYRGDRIQIVVPGGDDFGCAECHVLDRVHDDALVEALGYCDTLRAIAAPYADHPDFDPAWRP